MAGFIKLIRDSEESVFLDSKPIESHLLRIIAKRARRSDCAFTGLQVGQALIGDTDKIGITRQQYRTAKSNLQKWGLITTTSTTKGTIATLVSTAVYDINSDQPNQQDNNQVTNEETINQPTPNQQPTTNKECKKVNKVKNVKNKTVVAYESDIAYQLFDYWRDAMGKDSATKPTLNRINKIKARIKEGYTPDQIKLAINGCAKSEYHMGKNNGAKIYNCLTLICRSAEKLDQFIGYANIVNPQHQREAEREAWANDGSQDNYQGGITIDQEAINNEPF